jgi:hypothetical protein
MDVWRSLGLSSIETHSQYIFTPMVDKAEKSLVSKLPRAARAMALATMPTPGYDYPSRIPAEVNALDKTVAATTSTQRL